MLGFASMEQAFPFSTLPHAVDRAPAGLTSSSFSRPAWRWSFASRRLATGWWLTVARPWWSKDLVTEIIFEQLWPQWSDHSDDYSMNIFILEVLMGKWLSEWSHNFFEFRKNKKHCLFFIMKCKHMELFHVKSSPSQNVDRLQRGETWVTVVRGQHSRCLLSPSGGRRRDPPFPGL